MSFRVKTILLLVFLSLAPYMVTMVLLGNAYRNDYENRIRNNMEYQLGITVDRLDQNLQALEKDMHFIASLDIMNDVLTGDLDRRITNLLVLKKDDLRLRGNFDVVDNDGIIVASSDIGRVGSVLSGESFLSVPLHSTFSEGLIGELILHYEFENLTRFFANDDYLRYSLMVSGEEILDQIHVKDSLRVERSLIERPEIAVMLEQDREFAFSLLDEVERSFYIALVVGIALIGTIAFIVAHYLVQPILLLASTARSVTKTQDYSQRVTVERSDEIGQLAGAFNLMIGGMQEMIDRLKEESENKLKLVEEKNRVEMLQTLSTKLSRYLSPQIYESIFSGEKDVTLSSSRKKLTIFFSDIVNFTGTTDEMESEDLTQLLNSYLREMTDIALEFGATVDKYIGDAIMIFFGDPQSKGVTEDAKLCVEMAINMQRRVKELQAEWQSTGFSKPFAVRIGIHTGYCTVGNFGTENRMDYTIVGSGVNLASRIETNAEPGTIFISEDTYLLVRDSFSCIPATKFTPKGITQAIQLYQVVVDDSDDSLVASAEGYQLNVQPDKLTRESKSELKLLLEKLLGNL
jgi:class 3 adenylate cyclase/HAMP domain-containing protein